MPLVPHFELSQNDSEVIVTVFVKTIRLESIEVLLDDDSILHFHALPYSLTLNFAPCQFDAQAEGIVSAQYDPSLGQITIPLKKAHKGENWPNLDMRARLMKPKEIPKQWLHAVMDSKENDDNNDNSDDENDTEENTHANSTIPDEASSLYGYGFGNIFQNIFTDYCRSGIAQEMLSLPDPETTEPSERRSQRIHQEQEDFDADRYDYEIPEDDYLYDMVMEFVPFWKKQSVTNKNDSEEDGLVESLQSKLKIEDTTKTTTTPSTSSNSPFTKDEKLQLSTIPYPLIPPNLLQNHEALWCGLLDLLVPFVYDHLLTMGDPTVESAWTITKLSCSLNWLDPPSTVPEAVVGTTRRLLIYPYWRNLDFSIHVWQHLLSMLESSRDALHLVIQSLLKIRSILEKSEFYYAGNKVFVDPYLYWVQHQDVSDLKVLAQKVRQQLEKGTLKQDVNLDLDIYENLVFGDDDEEEGSGDDDTTSSSESSDSEDKTDDDDDKDNDESSAETHPSAQRPNDETLQITKDSETTNVSSTLLELEDESIKRSHALGMVEESSSAPPRKGKMLIEELN